MEVIPAIDLRGGRCVRLWQGDYAAETVFSDDPVEVAQEWTRQGARRLHLVDLDGARAGQPSHFNQLSSIATAVTVPVQYGGGLRSDVSVEQALAAGAAHVILGTAAIRRPDWLQQLLQRYPNRIIVSVDTRGGQPATAGWLHQEGPPLPNLLTSLRGLGVQEIIHTAIDRDGTMAGPDLQELQVALASGLRVTAAGGVSSLADLQALRDLSDIGLQGAIVGRALYEQRFTLSGALALVAGGESHVG